MKLAISALLVAISIPTAALAQHRTVITPEEYLHRVGNCPCNYNHARDGSWCGKRSAFCRCSGYEPIGCFFGDDDPDKRINLQLEHCGYACLYRRN